MKDEKTFGEAIGGAIFSAIKPLYKAGEKRRRSSNRPERDVAVKEPKEMDLKAAAFAVMEEAARHVSDNYRLRYSCRSLFYEVRKRIQRHTTKTFNPETGYSYFRDKVRVEFEQKHGKLTGLYIEPVGEFFEPHSGKEIRLGTLEFENYEFPGFQYDKLLYVEKAGLLPTFQDSGLGQRYDMAIATGKGYATTTARKLLSAASTQRNYTIFVLHDCDYTGYNIARTVREETRQMPSHNIEVVDLGLTVRDAHELGLEFERTSRKNAIPAKVEAALTKEERECFIGHPLNQKTHRCWRVELQFLEPPRMIEFIESKLEEAGATGKVVPPKDELSRLAEEMYREEIHRRTEQEVRRLVDLPAIQQAVADEFQERFSLENARQWIDEAFEDEDSQSWRDGVVTGLHAAAGDHSAGLSKLVEEKMRHMIKERGE